MLGRCLVRLIILTPSCITHFSSNHSPKFPAYSVLSCWQAVAGLISDSRQIVETARTEAGNYRTQYGDDIPLKYLNDRVSMFMHAYTLYSAVRPFGCSFIIGSWNAVEGPCMYMVDPSGVSYVSTNIRHAVT